MTPVVADPPPKTVASPNPRKNHRPIAKLNPLEIEVVAFFVQICRLLGHPCKIYNVLTVGAPVLYIGPRPSHLSDIFSSLDGDYHHASADHGDIDKVVEHIKRAREQTTTANRKFPQLTNLSKKTVLPKLIDILESA
jgi:hypothetical protein